MICHTNSNDFPIQNYVRSFKKGKKTQVNKTCVVITHSDNKYTTVRLF